ncbi:Histidyl-tRNA synthetase [hydrothermal vent metagenome]|uniref:histidine--tRNA ligase n=1 Tax=hydrothermal vent metagenome TaxID=652676 RepID=A0A3B1E0U4_9ZZZZ
MALLFFFAMSKKFSLPRGTSDILPFEMPSWQFIESKARDILKFYNYKEFRTPVFEETGLFKRSLGQTSDVVNKQLLELASDKEDTLSLRPEGTAAIVRSYIENSLDRKEAISKLFYIGPMFRGERPQKGRLRQFHQIGVEALGVATSSPYLDSEVMALSVNILKSFGLNNFQLKINTLGAPEDKEEFSKQLRSELKSSVDELCADCQQRFERNVFRILDCKNRGCKRVVAGLSIGDSYLSAESKVYYEDVKKALRSLNVDFVEDSNLVRGLDYYTHTVFEISDSSLGSQDALGAGGRYNNLVSQLGGAEVDAVGFALGMERILLAMPKEQILAEDTLDIYIVNMDEQAFMEGFRLLNVFRGESLSADMSYKISSMKSQMRAANKSKAKYVVILGEEELKNGEATVKNMASSEQERIPLQMVGKALKERLNSIN